MQRRFHLPATRRQTAARLGIVAAAQLDDGAGDRILHDALALDDVRVAQADLATGREPEEFARRLLHEVVLLDVELARERQPPRTCRGVFRIVHGLELFDPVVGVVLDDDLERVQHGHDARGAAIQVLADAVLEHRDVDDAVALRHADAVAKRADRFGRVPPPPEARDRGHAGIVPAADVAARHQRQQLPLAHHGVRQVQPRELDLLRVTRGGELVEHPIVERSVDLELERADRVRDAFERVREAVREVVERIDAPPVARAVMGRAPNAVERRVAQVDVGRRHVDLRAQHVRPVRELTRPHAREEIAVLSGAALAVRAVPSRLGEGAAIGADVVGRQAVDVGLAVVDQPQRELEELLEVVRRVEELVGPVESEPAHVFHDRVDVLDVFLGRIGVVEAEMADAAVLLRQAEIQADALGVPDVQIPVRLGWEAGDDASVVLLRTKVVFDDVADEVRRAFSGHARGILACRTRDVERSARRDS